MPTVSFAPALTRHVPCPPQEVDALSVRAALDAAFLAAPPLRHYVLDEQGGLRKHVALFVNGEMLLRPTALERPLAARDQLMVIQALTGG
ncbi:MoaD/ThiS family protein [Ramlibacter sp.]|uniref:MoaD/ThiS family protein n=1 Tax=Ramlibacter sp. TaxID=1917967 RepID=UPI002FCA85E5|nr:molybdopterin synthase subunit MoaD [Ramlibacter sp.]